jgi:DNA-binding transcriptional ArsR family regulator
MGETRECRGHGYAGAEAGMVNVQRRGERPSKGPQTFSGCTAREIAELTGMSESTVRRSLYRLEEKGLVVRHPRGSSRAGAQAPETEAQS